MVRAVCGSESEHVREDREKVSASRWRVPCNARLNLCRKASTTASVRRTLSCAWVRLHEQRPREVGFIFRLVRAESAGVRGDGLMYGLNERASCARSFSKSYKPDSSAERNPDPAGPSLCKNKGDRIFIAVSKRITGLGPATSTLARLRSTK